jgi:hypothetical protein
MKPVLQALVLAERIYEDKDSRKKIIAGTFNTFNVAPAPSITAQLPDGSKRLMVPGGTDPGSPSAYISLTDVVDGTEIILQYVNVSRNRVVFQAGMRINTTSRLDTIEIVAPLPPASQLAIEPGTFSLDVVWNGEILGSHRIQVISHPAPSSGE